MRIAKSDMQKTLFSLIFFGFLSSVFAQNEDTILLTDSTFAELEENTELFQEFSKLDPQKAALLSTVFPGLGQIYNRQYWKVPIIFSGLLIFAHYITFSNRIYNSFRNAAILITNGQPNPFDNIASLDAVARNRDNFRRERDFRIVLGTVFYLLQIVDAHVSAHLDEFIVNKDLALQIKPSIQSTPLFSQSIGLSLVLKF